MKKVISSIVMALVITAVVALGYCEFYSRYEEGERYVELDNWGMYGDALIRFTKSNEHPADAIVVKAAYKQIDDYELQLQDGMRRTEGELELAMQGVRNSTGARGLLNNAGRILTLRSPQWPAQIQLSEQEQAVRVTKLRERLRSYEESLHSIEVMKAPPVAVPTTP